VALHMVSGVAVAGNVGATAIADRPEEADDLMTQLRGVLDRAAAPPDDEVFLGTTCWNGNIRGRVLTGPRPRNSEPSVPGETGMEPTNAVGPP